MTQPTVGEVIRQKRREAGLTLKDVGEILGVSRMQVSRIERGERALHMRHAKKLAELFGWEIVKQAVEEQG